MEYQKIGEIISAFGLQNETRLSLLDFSELSHAHMPPFPPDASALVLCHPENNPGLAIQALKTVYPPDFRLKLLDQSLQVKTVSLSDLDGQAALAFLIPSLGPGSSLEAFQELIAHLRAPVDNRVGHLKFTTHIEAWDTCR